MADVVLVAVRNLLDLRIFEAISVGLTDLATSTATVRCAYVSKASSMVRNGHTGQERARGRKYGNHFYSYLLRRLAHRPAHRG
jgi:hypothetical protein